MGLEEPLATRQSHQQVPTMGCHSRTLFFTFCCSTASRSCVASLSKAESWFVFSWSLEGQDAGVRHNWDCCYPQLIRLRQLCILKVTSNYPE